MIDRKSTKYRTFLIIASCLLLGGVAIVAVKLVGKKMIAQRMVTSEAAYARGLSAYEAKDFNQANTEFEAAIREAALGIQEIDSRTKGQASADPVLNEQRARLAWNYYRASRDRAYAKAHLEEKPIPEILDTTTRQRYRSMIHMPDANERNNLGQLLRQMAIVLPKEADIQLESMRVELGIPQTEWGMIKKVAEQTIELNPTDARARYMLAYIEFEQPTYDGKVIADDKREMAKVLAARDHLEQAKQAEYYPVWRTYGLEAKIIRWLLSRPAEQQRSLVLDKEKARLKELVADDKKGLPAMLAKKEGFDAITRFDAKGMADLFVAAAEYTAAEPNGSLASILHRFASTMNELPEATTDPAQIGDMLDVAIEQFTRYSELAKMRESVVWGQALNALDQCGKRVLEKKVCPAKRCADLGQVYVLEGKPRYQQALFWATQGLQLEANEDIKADLHLVCMKLKTTEGRPTSEIRPHADALKKSPSKKGQAIAANFEATTALDNGKFDLARRWFEEVVSRPEGGELVLRGYVILPDLYLASGRPIEAAAYARELDRGYERITSASRSFQVWAADYYRTQQDVVALVVVSQYETARQKVEREKREHPERAITPEITRIYEETAQRAMDRIGGKSTANMQARIARCEFLSVARPDEAKKELETLRADYPDSLAVLRVEFAHTDAVSRRKVDDRVKKLAEKPTQAAIWAEWLFLSDRSNEAIAHLESLPAPEAKALAGLLKGNMNRDAIVDALFARSLISDETAPHHEREAAQHLRTALAAVAANKPVDAGEAFRKVSEHVLYRHAAREGLKWALASISKSDPAIAQKLSAEWMP